MYVCMYTIRAKKFEAFKGDATNENVANVANEKKVMKQNINHLNEK